VAQVVAASLGVHAVPGSAFAGVRAPRCPTRLIHSTHMEESEHHRSQQEHFAIQAEARDAENEGKTRTYARKADLVARTLAGAESVVEIGCGSGLFTQALSRRVPTLAITATDAFPEVLHRAKRRNAEHVKFLLYDAEGDPHQAGIGGDFDAVCGVDILHHIERPILALSNWMRLVRPGGRLVILESNPKNPVLFLRLYGRPAERRVFKNTRKNLRTWASDAGWGSVSVSYAPIYLPNCRETLWPAFAAVEEVIHSMRIARPLSGLYCVEALRPVAP
jgi:SAM-dependent methyltransferase